jgi:hypothetical protein
MPGKRSSHELRILLRQPVDEDRVCGAEPRTHRGLIEFAIATWAGDVHMDGDTLPDSSCEGKCVGERAAERWFVAFGDGVAADVDNFHLLVRAVIDELGKLLPKPVCATARVE